MNRPLPDNGIPVKNGDLSFIFKGVYHPIVWYGDEPYRPRVETLVIKDGRYVYLNIYDTNTAIKNERLGSYELPGGSIDNDCDKITQAENEVNEEILIKIKNIYHTGVQYYETFSDENVEEFKKESPLSYRGFMSEVYCAEYAGKFDARNVEDKDLDPDMQKGKFYPISLVADKLTEPHIAALLNCPFVNDQSKMALQLYVRARGVTIESVSESRKLTHNDKGEPVPETCPDCGSKVAIYLRGEPVFLCSNDKCGKYFGTVPCESSAEEMKRSELPDDAFGIPEERKYPLDTEEHVRSAIKLFNHVDNKYEADLAKRIITKMKEYNISDITVGDKNRFSKYYKPVSESSKSATKSYKYRALTNKEALNAANKLIKSDNPTLSAFGLSIKLGVETTFDNFIDILGKINSLFYVGLVTTPAMLFIVVGVVLLAIETLPFSIIAEALKRQRKFLRTSIRKDEKLLGEYYDIIDNIVKSDGNVSVIEAMLPVMEAPDEEDELTDYTSDAEEGPTDEEDELTDYTDDVDDDPEEDTPGDETGVTDENPEEDPAEDSEDDLTDYTDDVSTDDDTGDSTDTDTLDDTSDSTSEDTETGEVDKNITIKNYNLILDFQTLFKYLEEICTGLESTVFKTPIQNSALTQIVNNMRKIRNAVANYIEFNYGNDYITNLYNYNIFVKALKLNLEMLQTTKDLHEENSTN